MTRDLEGQVAVVTGAGRGLGREFVRGLVARGVHVVVNDIARNEDGRPLAEVLVEEVVAAGGVAVASAESIAEPDGASRIIERCVDEFGALDILVNNAALIRQAAFEDVDLQHLDDMLGVNLRGTVLVTQAAYGPMRAAGHGRVVSLTSGAGLFGMRGQLAYGAAKAGLLGMTKVLAIEGRQHGVSANLVMPAAATSPGRSAIEWTRDVRRTLGPRLQPEGVVPLVVELSRPGCLVTGQIYSAVAGRYARAAVGVSRGWLAETVGQHDLAEHWSSIDSAEGMSYPDSLEDEFAVVAEQIWQRDGRPDERSGGA